ncbi:MAG TPA: hydroxymethylglutaryl-CoA reductase, degradative [Candidatus Nanopelagicaceae bacterium]|nr:hydroxymethylglutaryl-CoA reductase, degradative [Candidatus Nanopelagicaceae bacterium]
MTDFSSDISGFYKLSLEERQRQLVKLLDLNQEEFELMRTLGYFSPSQIDRLIENVVGSYQLPLGIAFNFKINSKDYIIPMVTEEPSVVAAASKIAKIARENGGFKSDEVKSIMISQIQLTKLEDIDKAKENIAKNKEKILSIANEQDPLLNKLGGGAKDLEVREIETRKGKMLILHLLVDVRDAMGANVVNTMAEAVSPYIENLCNAKIYLRIVSNLATHRIAKSSAVFDKNLLGGEEVVEGILNAYEFAVADPYRATTHNKGIMNGVVALALATGNDTRALEAGAHAYASLGGNYKPLTKFDLDSDGNLVGEIEIPLALGIIGGTTRNHPMARLALKILKVESAEELAQVAAALGLAQNVGALRALASEGIQKGHMSLHSKNIAKLAGATEDIIEEVAMRMVKDKKIRVDYAKEIIELITKSKNL